MKLSQFLATLSGAVSSAEFCATGMHVDAELAQTLIEGLSEAASAAQAMERQIEQIEAVAQDLDLVAFAKAGEPRPSADVLDLSEILGREQVSRITSEAGPVAKLYVFPTVPRINLDVSHFDGGDAA